MCGSPLGSMPGGGLASQLIPAYGWGTVFLAGGVLPLPLVPVVLVSVVLVSVTLALKALRR